MTGRSPATDPDRATGFRRPPPSRLPRILVVLAIVAGLGTAAFFGLPRLAAALAARELERLAARLPGRVVHGSVRLAGLSAIELTDLAWTDGTDLAVELRGIHAEIDPFAAMFGGSKVGAVVIDSLAARLGDPEHPFAKAGDAMTRLREVFDAIRTRPGGSGNGGPRERPGSALPDLHVTHLEGRLHARDADLTVADGRVDVTPAPDTLDATIRRVTAAFRISRPGDPDRRVDASAMLGAGLRPESAEVHVAPPLTADLAGGTAGLRGLSWKAGELVALEPSWSRTDRVALHAQSVAVRWEDGEPPAGMGPDALLGRLAHGPVPQRVRAALEGHRLREVEVSRPVLDVVLAPEAPPPPRLEPVAPSAAGEAPKAPEGEPAPRPEGVFRKGLAHALSIGRDRLARLQALLGAGTDLPAGRLLVHGATVRYLMPGAEPANPERSLARLDASVTRDPKTGRIDARLAFECPEAAAAANEFTVSIDPVTGAASGSLKAGYLPLYPYRAALPAGILADRSTVIRQSDLSFDVRPADGTLTAKGTLHVIDAAVDAPSVASVPLHQMELALSGSLAASLKGGEARLSDGRFELGQVHVPFDLAVTGLPDAPRVAIHAAVERVRAQDLVDSIPAAAIPALEGVRLAGSFAAKFDVDIDTRDLSAVHLDFKPDVADLTVVDLGRGVNLEVLRHQFLHRIEEGGGKVVSRTIGPTSADWLPIAEVPRFLVDALTTSEDSQFFTHHGFSVAGIRRSLSVNLERGGFYQGASTLSQQLVKNLFLSHEKTLARKLQEVFITWQLERFLEKEKILELYLNVIEWGPEVWGLRQAAMHYFGKIPKELSLLESAFLVTVIPNPRLYHVHFENGAPSPAFEARIKGLVREMGRRNLVPAEQAEAALEQHLRFVPAGDTPASQGTDEPPDDEFSE